MSSDDPPDLQQIDKALAQALIDRDESVLAQIKHYYGPSLRKWCRSIGMTSSDTDDVIQRALFKTWENYKPNGPVWNYFFRLAGKSAAIDIRREKLRHKRLIQEHADRLAEEPKLVPLPIYCVLEGEQISIKTKLLSIISEAKDSLTGRQRTAFNHRFAPEAPRNWATELAEQTEHDAKYWRKASDDAIFAIKQRVDETLRELGLIVEQKGGLYEISKRDSA